MTRRTARRPEDKLSNTENRSKAERGSVYPIFVLLTLLPRVFCDHVVRPNSNLQQHT